MRKYLALTWGDLKSISRDSFLIMIYCIPLFIATVFRFGIPYAAELVSPWIDLSEHYPFIMSFLAFLTPSFVGMVMGFMLLDERDEDILSYLAVTPLTRSAYLLYRISSPMLISFLLFYLLQWIANLTPVPIIPLIPVSIMAALEAPILALFLAVFANNKVEGLAVYKLTGIIFLAPFVGYFVRSGWQYIAGIFPPFWISKLFLAALQGDSTYGMYLLGGLFVHGGYLAIMLRLFNRRSAP